MVGIIPPDFIPRACPICAASRAQTLFCVEPRQFAAPNPTYAADYAAILGVSPDDKFPVARCSDCGFVFAGLEPTRERLALVYERVIDGGRALQASADRNDRARRLAYLRVLTAHASSGAAALDFGAGYGVTSRMLAACGFATVAYDNSPSRHETLTAIPGVRVATDERELRANGPFEVVVADNVLEHLVAPDAAVALLASLCKPDAMLFVSVPSCEPHEIAAVAARLAREQSCDLCLNPWEHLNYFSVTSLDGLLTRHRFRPLPAVALGAPIDIGLRAETRPLARWKNALASAVRLARFAVSGEGAASVNARFYRYEP